MTKKVKFYFAVAFLSGMATVKIAPLGANAVVTGVRIVTQKMVDHDNELFEKEIEYKNKEIMKQKLSKIQELYEETNDPTLYYMIQDLKRAIQDGNYIDLDYQKYYEQLETWKEETKRNSF